MSRLVQKLTGNEHDIAGWQAANGSLNGQCGNPHSRMA